MTTSAKKTPAKKAARKKASGKSGVGHHAPGNGSLRRETDPDIDRRLPPDLKAAAEALVAAPAPDQHLRRHSARREQIVQLKPYIMHSVAHKNASAMAIFDTLRQKTKLNFSRRFISDFINLWSGEITVTGLERIAGELFRGTYDAAALEAALKVYGAEDQAERIAELIRLAKKR